MDPQIEAGFRRDERQMRIVQAVVGALIGAGVSLYCCLRATDTGWEMLAWVIGGAVSGAVAGYLAPPWSTALDD